MYTELTDWELLARYAAAGEGGAFDEIVRRHINFVYVAARRQVGSDAEDVTQAVFLLLAQKARTLHGRGPMIAWLYGATRMCCLNLRRTERRRKQREWEAAMKEELTMGTDTTEAAGHLDAGLSALKPREREVVLLRFFEEKSFAEAARVLGISEEAARKRGQRGVERLRCFFQKRGIALGAAGVSALLMGEAAKAAPVALAASVSAGAAGGGLAAAGGGVKVAVLAKQTWAALASMSWKPVAAVLILSVSSVATVTAVTRPWMRASGAVVPVAAALPAGVKDEAKAPGDVCVAVADLLVDTDGAEALGKISEALKAEGTFYALRRGSAADFHGTLKELLEGRHVMSMSDEIYRGSVAPKTVPGQIPPLSEAPVGNLGSTNFQEFTRNPNVFYSAIYFGLAGGSGARSGRVGASKPYLEAIAEGNSARLNIQFDDVLARVTGYLVRTDPPREFTPENSLAKQASVHWSGSLMPGQVLLMIGDFGEWKNEHFVHVRVTEVYKATAAERRFFHLWTRLSAPRNLPVTRLWAEGGEPALLEQIDNAIVYGSKAAATSGPGAKWVRKMSDGREVALMGLSSPTQWPMVRWDPDGRPAPYRSFDRLAQDEQAQTLFATIRLPGTIDMAGPSECVEVVPEDAGRLTVYVGTGPWTEHNCDGEGAVMFEGQAMKVNTRPMRNNMAISAHLTATSPPEIQMQIAVRNKKGELVKGSSSYRPVIQEKLRTLASPRVGAGVDRYFDFPPEEVDHYVLMTRPRESVAFEGFASAPGTMPVGQVSAEELRAAEGRLAKALLEQCMEDRAAAYAELNALPRDPGTPEGAMRMMMDKAAAGDVKGVREFLTGQEERVAAAAAALAARYHALDLCVKKFGAGALQRAYTANDFDVADGAVIALPEKLLLRRWFVQGDRASVVAFVTLVQRDGKWRFDLDRFFEQRRTKPEFEQAAKDADAFLKEFEAGKITTPEQVLQGLHLPTSLMY